MSRRLLVSALVFLAAAALFWLVLFATLSYAFTCPITQPQCDLPGMAAFALASLVSPLLSLIPSVIVFRRMAIPRAAQGDRS
jgi:hypothetical protein